MAVSGAADPRLRYAPSRSEPARFRSEIKSLGQLPGAVAVTSLQRPARPPGRAHHAAWVPGWTRARNPCGQVLGGIRPADEDLALGGAGGPGRNCRSRLTSEQAFPVSGGRSRRRLRLRCTGGSSTQSRGSSRGTSRGLDRVVTDQAPGHSGTSPGRSFPASSGQTREPDHHLSRAQECRHHQPGHKGLP